MDRAAHPAKRSIKDYFIISFFAISLIFTAVYVTFSVYITRSIRRYAIDNVVQSYDAYQMHFRDLLTSNIGYLVQNCFDNSDITSLGICPSGTDEYVYTNRIQLFLMRMRSAYPSIDGSFIYSASKDVFITGLDINYNPNDECAETIKELLHEGCINGTLDELNTRDWFFMSGRYGDYLVRIVSVGGTLAGSWTNISNFTPALVPGALISCIDEEGRVFGSRIPEELLPKLADGSGRTRMVRLAGKGNYMAIEVPLSFASCRYLVLVPSDTIEATLRPLVYTVPFILIWLIALIFTTYEISIRAFRLPGRILTPITRNLTEDSLLTPVVVDAPFVEMQQIMDIYNELTAKIEGLKIRVYEEELAKKDFQMKFMKSQVAPHFLVNCLNTILVSSVYDQDPILTEDIISALSDHLRYTLADRETVTLFEEAQYVKNYLHLSSLRFPGCLKYEVDIGDDVRKAEVFPLILITLSENSVKHGLIMGKLFRIRICCRRFERDGEPRLKLIHEDSGPGLTDEQLARFNGIAGETRAEENALSEMRNSSIGLYNTATRLKLIFGESASLSFSNIGTGGLRVEIDVPLRLARQDRPMELPAYEGEVSEEKD